MERSDVDRSVSTSPEGLDMHQSWTEQNICQWTGMCVDSPHYSREQLQQSCCEFVVDTVPIIVPVPPQPTKWRSCTECRSSRSSLHTLVVLDACVNCLICESVIFLETLQGDERPITQSNQNFSVGLCVSANPADWHIE